MTQMTAEQQRIAIAEEVGFVRYERPWDGRVFLCSCRPGVTWKTTTKAVDMVDSDIPNYLHDLNACAEFEKTLSRAECDAYHNHLIDIVREEKPTISECLDGKLWSERWTWHASAPQRCEAFLRTKNLWTDQ